MILSVLYLICFLFIIQKHSFFNDTRITRKQFSLFFILKLSGILVYNFVFADGFLSWHFNSDTQLIMDNARVIYNALFNVPLDFLKLLIGYHSKDDYWDLHQLYFSKMQGWENPDNAGFRLNDMQAIVRINACILCFSAGDIITHVITTVFIAFLGGVFMYKAFKFYFNKKETPLLVLILFIPSVYFWTSGVLKEPIVFFNLGVFLFAYFKLFIERCFTIKNILILLSSLILFWLLKPYVLAAVLSPLFVFTIIEKQEQKKYWIYPLFIALSILLTCETLRLAFNKNIFEVIAKRQNDFVNIGYGGMFFYKDGKYVRLEHDDYDKIVVKNLSEKTYSLKSHINYVYWNIPNIEDSIFVKNNTDTLTAYTLMSNTVPSNSLIQKQLLKPNWRSYLNQLPRSLYNSFLYPLFSKCRNSLDLLASLENLILLFFIGLAIAYRTKNIEIGNLVFFLSSSILVFFLLIGYSTAIGGALVRYKMPLLPFLWMIPLLILDTERIKSRLHSFITKW